MTATCGACWTLPARFPKGPTPSDIDGVGDLLFYGETADPTSGFADGEIRVVFEGKTVVRVDYP